MITLTQPAASGEPVQFAVSAIDAGGNTIDPSVYAVAVAFPAITSPPVPFNPGTATWFTAAWAVQAGNPGAVYWVTVTPGAGGAALAAGSYLAYTKITGASASPVLLQSAWLILT